MRKASRFPGSRSTALVLLSAAVILAASRSSAQQSNPPDRAVPTVSAPAAAGHRLWVMVFDMSAMQADALLRAKVAAVRWIDESMGKDDLVSVLTVRTSLTLLQNFTTSVDRARTAVGQLRVEPELPAKPGQESLQDRDFFNNDLRYRGLRTLCTGLLPIEQKKAILLFTAMRDQPVPDNQIEVRAAADACRRANATINPVDVSAPHLGGG